METLTVTYDTISNQLVTVLAEAADAHREDRSYHSPLHCAIMSVEGLHVLRADTVLLRIVGYALDVKTVPDGTLLMGEDFYPAARALVKLRVDVDLVLAAMQIAKTPQEVRLLTWVLFKRVRTVDEVKRLLDTTKGKGGSVANLAQASKFLELPADDLLPPPGSGK